MGSGCTKVAPDNTVDDDDGSSSDTNTYTYISDYDESIEIDYDEIDIIDDTIAISKSMLSFEGVTYHCHQGRRDYQEDRGVITKMEDGREIYAIFDGHGGADVSERAQTDYMNVLKRMLRKGERSLTMEEIMHKSFLEFGQSVRNYNAGSTAVVCVLDRNDGTLTVSNVGDSFCLTIDSDNKTVKRISEDHTPEGGSIQAFRGISGRLCMYQSFGDFRYPVVYHGFHKTVSLNGLSHIVLASDGVSHRMSDIEVFEVVFGIDSDTNIAKLIVDKVVNELNGHDNTTAIVIDLDISCS